MSPLTLAEITALLALPAGDLKPYQLDQLVDALRRRSWDDGNPGVDPATQATLTAIAATWSA